MEDGSSASTLARTHRGRPRRSSYGTPGSAAAPTTAAAAAAAAASEPSQPWTATRCLRLLRPLLAHVAALRKDKERRALLGARPPGGSADPKPRRTVLGKRSYPGSDSDYGDKKPCRKYSRRGGRGRRPSTTTTSEATTPRPDAQRQRRQLGHRAPQDIVVPTPFLRRVRSNQPSSPAQAPEEPSPVEDPPAGPGRCSHLGCSGRHKCAFEVELKMQIRPSTSPERHGLYESVFKAFDAILRATAPPKKRQAMAATGPRSLLAMCLRKVPEYIAGIEEWERQESEEKGTKTAVQGAGATFDVYSELESLGTMEGWRHLCLLVRAHAVSIVQNAVAEGLFEDGVTDVLIRVCLEYMRPAEITGLIDAFVVRRYAKPLPGDAAFLASPALRPLQVLLRCDACDASIMPRTLARLLANGLLPADWVLNKTFLAMWPAAIRQITKDKPCQGAMDLLSVTLELLCSLAAPRKPRGVPQTRLRGGPQTILIGAVATLGSVVLLSQDAPSSASDSTATRTALLRRRVIDLITATTTNLKRSHSAGRKLGSYVLALCSFLSLNEQAPPGALGTAWRGSANEAKSRDPHLLLQYDATVVLASAMAHHCARGTGLAPHVHLEQLCDRLEDAAMLPPAALASVRVDAAFRLAELTGDLRDLDAAEALMRARQQQQQEEETVGSDAGNTVAMATTTPKRVGWIGGAGASTKRAAVRDVKGGKTAASFAGVRWDDGISEWVAATPGSEMRPRGRPGLRSRGRVDSDDDDHKEREEEEASELEDHSGPGLQSTPISMDDSVSETDDNDDDDDDDTGTESDADMDVLSPDTEVSPEPTSRLPSNPSSSKARQHKPWVLQRGNHNQESDDDDAADENNQENRPHPGQPQRKSLSQTPTPAQTASAPATCSKPSTIQKRLLQVQPRRLSRRLAWATHDELTLDETSACKDDGYNDDDDDDDSPRTRSTQRQASSWLAGKQPARFRLLSRKPAGCSRDDPCRSGASDGGSRSGNCGRSVKNQTIRSGARAGSGNNNSSSSSINNISNAGGSTSMVKKKRLTRASLVHLRSSTATSTAATNPHGRTAAAAPRHSFRGGHDDSYGYGYDGDSEDELSFI
ncbi:hypothetical protein VTJ83DRAFT_929 [Remersonia thermophila]|uniref:Wings apart-like protein C-terminal domain-containing protein n=1 Tax=Remersonia thermophila TaxID=72144 RepID=A0ABR4DMJ1_9PEZI